MNSARHCRFAPSSIWRSACWKRQSALRTSIPLDFPNAPITHSALDFIRPSVENTRAMRAGRLFLTHRERDGFDASKLQKLYLSGRQGTRGKPASGPALDLTDPCNVPDHRRRAEVLLSLLLFTARNERAHGSMMSQFRTSKATLVRFESYYATMLAGYVYALGAMGAAYGQSNAADILAGLRSNVRLQQEFFAG